MLDLLVEGGLYFTIPLTVLALLALILIVWGIWVFFRDRSDKAAFRRRLELLLHVGLLGFIVGIFGQALGLYQMLKAIEGVGQVSPALVAGGLAVSAIAPLYGLSILTVSFIAWITLRHAIT